MKKRGIAADRNVQSTSIHFSFQSFLLETRENWEFF